jgi:transposase
VANKGSGACPNKGNRYLGRLLTIGATAVMRRLPGKTDWHSAWVRALLERRPFRLVSLALANKMARIAWAIMVRQEDYRKPLAAAA